jgi:UDP-N-acetylglucosamine 1-carboxyvinyltransferase
MAIVLATQVEGPVLFHAWMFESRLFWVDSLISMGARLLLCDPHRVLVSGRSQLYGRLLTSPDIRAGMALLIAGLLAEGETIIKNINQIDRGYEDITTRLNALGAGIRLIEH